MRYDKPKLRIEEWEEEDVVTESLTDGGENNEDSDTDPWIGGDNVDDSWW